MAGFQPTVMLTMFKYAGKMGSHENHSQCLANNDEQQSDEWSPMASSSRMFPSTTPRCRLW